MPDINITINYEQSRSIRCRQLESVFDVPSTKVKTLKWKGSLPIENMDWSIGMITGPSGCGKSVIGRELFKETYHKELKWNRKSIIDDFDKTISITEISSACQAVGFNTIPAWMRPFKVLSMGEQFRVDIARRLIESPSPVVVDEFSSVVDRQVAKICSYAIQKYIRRGSKKQFVAISCHDDIEEWLNPDWVFEPATMTFRPRGLLQQVYRPPVVCEIRRVPYSVWEVFAPFHYLTKSLNKGSKCFGLFIENKVTAFAGILHRPISRSKHQNLLGVSRLVTLPDYQGLGLSFVLMKTLAAAYKTLGYRLKIYPAHPSFILSTQRSSDWEQTKKPEIQQYINPDVDSFLRVKTISKKSVSQLRKSVSRPCAIFNYVGPEFKSKEEAYQLIEGRKMI